MYTYPLHSTVPGYVLPVLSLCTAPMKSRARVADWTARLHCFGSTDLMEDDTTPTRLVLLIRHWHENSHLESLSRMQKLKRAMRQAQCRRSKTNFTSPHKLKGLSVSLAFL